MYAQVRWYKRRGLLTFGRHSAVVKIQPMNMWIFPGSRPPKWDDPDFSSIFVHWSTLKGNRAPFGLHLKNSKIKDYKRYIEKWFLRESGATSIIYCTDIYPTPSDEVTTNTFIRTWIEHQTETVDKECREIIKDIQQDFEEYTEYIDLLTPQKITRAFRAMVKTGLIKLKRYKQRKKGHGDNKFTYWEIRRADNATG